MNLTSKSDPPARKFRSNSQSDKSDYKGKDSSDSNSDSNGDSNLMSVKFITTSAPNLHSEINVREKIFESDSNGEIIVTTLDSNGEKKKKRDSKGEVDPFLVSNGELDKNLEGEKDIGIVIDSNDKKIKDSNENDSNGIKDSNKSVSNGGRIKSIDKSDSNEGIYDQINKNDKKA